VKILLIVAYFWGGDVVLFHRNVFDNMKECQQEMARVRKDNMLSVLSQTYLGVACVPITSPKVGT
jgi:hypothetical protein